MLTKQYNLTVALIISGPLQNEISKDMELHMKAFLGKETLGKSILFNNKATEDCQCGAVQGNYVITVISHFFIG